jgi:hypothetical protein
MVLRSADYGCHRADAIGRSVIGAFSVARRTNRFAISASIAAERRILIAADERVRSPVRFPRPGDGFGGPRAEV